jgi:serine phosphatase RsbU (regulator of sigma subunit)
MIPGARFDEGAAPLAAGSRLVLYTDGVVEAACTGGDEMGDERLVAALAAMRGLGAREAARAVLDHAVRYAGGGPLADDATVVVVDVTREGRP